ncbi:MAG: GNAT family N-acetyltransferase [Terriglobales bacterium]
MSVRLRLATITDVPELEKLIERSVRKLQQREYTKQQIELALQSVYGVDTQLIADATYFAAEVEPGCIAGCGGWSPRPTLFGGDQWHKREAALLDPAREPARIRAFFVLPEWARQGIGRKILAACEGAAQAAGFHRLEMGATLSGLAFYRAMGYVPLETIEVPLGSGATLPVVRMGKDIVHAIY